MSNIQFRSPNTSDIEQLQGLLSELGYEAEASEIMHRLEHANPQSTIIVAEIDHKLVGAVQAEVNIRLAEGKYGEIVSLVVKKEYRTAGIGKQLVALAINYLRDCGCKTYLVRTNVKRQRAHKFYASLGFEEIKRQKVLKLNA